MLLKLIKWQDKDMQAVFQTFVESKSVESLILGIERVTEEALQKLFRGQFREAKLADLNKMRSFRNDEIFKLFKIFRED